jgi:xylan 1,4-beta-xylosidase
MFKNDSLGKMICSSIALLSGCTSLVCILSCGNAKTDETYANPVLVETFSSPLVGMMGIGDPAVVFYDGKYYLYPTGDNRSYHVYISADLVHWKKGPKVFQSQESGVWAPDVLYNPADKKFYLYYTANRRVGVAVADRPDSFFTDLGVLVRDAIDANIFLDDGDGYYLYYAEWPAFRIWVQPMATPLRKKGSPLEIVRPTELWEMKGRPVTEAPWMLKYGGTYYLLYSGGGADTEDYAIGYATSKSPIGPFSKYADNPIMKKGNGVFGPGHCAVAKTPDGRLWMVYHQKKDSSKGWDRIICIDPIWFDDKGVLHVKATRSVPQPSPFIKANSGGNRRRSAEVGSQR